MAGRQPNAPAAFTPEEIPGTQFSEAESTSGHMVLSGVPRKKSPVTPPEIDPGTVRLVAQRLNHYVTTAPPYKYIYTHIYTFVYTYIHMYIYIHIQVSHELRSLLRESVSMLKYTDITQNTYVQS